MWSERKGGLDTRQRILENFAACSSCGHFLASLLALLGNESLDAALTAETGMWIEFEWRRPMAEMLAAYYRWRFHADAERSTGCCPNCLRRVVYERVGEEASLQIERRPGYRT